MLPRPEEQRKFLRHPMRRAAELLLAGHEQRIRCKICDMSDGGARLAISHPTAALPRTFTMVMFRDTLQRDCEVVWTDRRYVGVKFVSNWYGAHKSKQ